MHVADNEICYYQKITHCSFIKKEKKSIVQIIAALDRYVLNKTETQRKKMLFINYNIYSKQYL